LALLALALQGCFDSVAVQGVPVKEVMAPERFDAAKYRAMRDAELAELAEMSRVMENDVFKEIDGAAEYRVGPLDVLEIATHVGDNVETKTVTVNNKGRISYSFIDDLQVAGLTPSELDEKLTKELSSYVRKPRIDVLVKEFNSKSALVLGEFASLRTAALGGQAASGKTPLKGKTKLTDLIAQAGGYTVNADIRSIRLMRNGQPHYINLYDIIGRGEEKQNVIIDDGDVVDIPEMPPYGERVYVMGEVAYQGIYPLQDARDLLGAVAVAGNTTITAKEENTLIVRSRGPGEEPLIMMADVQSMFRQGDISQNVPLQDGDLVYVPPMRIRDINDFIANIRPMVDLFIEPAYYYKWYDGEYMFQK
jgi:protein involved in polysaccharide export with SLBB domain